MDGFWDKFWGGFGLLLLFLFFAFSFGLGEYLLAFFALLFERKKKSLIRIETKYATIEVSNEEDLPEAIEAAKKFLKSQRAEFERNERDTIKLPN